VRNELSKYNIVSKYCRYLPELGRRETWEEAVDRTKEMMLKKYAYANIDYLIEEAYQFEKEKKLVGSMRAKQYGGAAMIKNNARGFNCTGSWCDRLRFFQEAFWLLLSGCGTGFSVQKHHIEKLPYFSASRIHDVEFFTTKIYQISDSIEGWADALGVLLESYFTNHQEYSYSNIEFDFSLIRPKGSYLSSGVGKAPGPEPLKMALETIRSLLDRCLIDGQNKLRSIDAYDIVMHASDAVLSGGVRRSATICLFSPDDELMMNAKTGDWFTENPQRARSNNSAVLNPDTVTWEQFSTLFECNKQFGEPGFMFGHEDMSCNPCAEIGFYPYDETTQESGWGFCNLCEINGTSCEDKDDFYERCIVASIIGTLQAGFTDFPYLTQASKNIAEREALLGVSITGVMDNYDLFIKENVLRTGALLCKQTNADVAKIIGINIASRITCNKPSGTVSCVMECGGSGVHPAHAKRFLRHVQVNRQEGPYQFFREYNPFACEKSVWSANDTDDMIAFAIDNSDRNCKIKHDVSANEFLTMVIHLQKNWIQEGVNEERLPKPWLKHTVSNTCVVKNNEWDSVKKYIFENRYHIACTSLLSASGDKDYPQAPFIAVYEKEHIISHYGINKQIFELIYESSNAHLEYYVQLQEIFKLDSKRADYLIKDITNLKKYTKILENYVPVDYTNMKEEHDNVQFGQEIACAGGACLI